MKSKINIFISFVIASMGLVFTTPTIVAAADCPGTTMLFPRWYDGMCDASGNIAGPGTAGSTGTKQTATNLGNWVMKIVLNIVQMLLMVVGYVSIAYIIFGGFKYMTQGDNSSGTAAARKTIQNAIIGLVLSIMSVAIVKFIAGVI